jgi:hypothetical protein
VSCSGAGSLEDLVASLLGSCGCSGLGGYSKFKSAAIRVDATEPAPFEVPLEGIAAVALLAFRPTAGMLLHLDSVHGGAAQKLPASGLVVLQMQTADDYFTAVGISGTGDVEYLIAGA